MRRLAVVAAAWALAVVPAFGGQAAPAASASAIAAVRAAYVKAVNAGEWAVLAALYTPDGVEMPPNAPAVKGRKAIEAEQKAMAAQVTFTNLTVSPLDTKVAGEIAYDAGTYRQQITPKGGKPLDDRGKYVVVLKKGADGAWQIAYMIFNSDLAAPAASK